MAKISTKKEGGNKLFWIIPVILFICYKGYQIYKKDDISSNTQNVENLLSKDENLLTTDEWKKIADYRAQELFECTKNLANDLESMAVYENCVGKYNNDRVLYNLGLDDKANLSSEEREILKDYWNKTEDEVSEKIIKLMDDNEKKLRPNRYSNE